MKFARREHMTGFEWTHRKLLAAESRPARERRRQVARYPLFADQAPEPAPFDPHLEARLRDQCARQAEQRTRDFHARVWRAARRDMQRASPEQQSAIRAGWQAWTGPCTSTYFRYVVDVHTGVMAQREAAFRARQSLVREEVARLLHAQRRLDLEVSDDGRNEPARSGLNPSNYTR